jgi:hypothetical protein
VATLIVLLASTLHSASSITTLRSRLAICRSVLERWRANRLLVTPKVYSYDAVVDLGRGADNDYQIETNDGTEFFLLDVRGPGRNPSKARFQLRYRRNIVLARMYLAAPRTNPDGTKVDSRHFHRYHEEYGDRIAEACRRFRNLTEALNSFCQSINLPMPNTDGGMS